MHLRWPLLKRKICFSCCFITIRIGNLNWNESYEKKIKHIHASVADLLHIKIRNLNWCKCRHCRNEAREIHCLCCREVNTMLIASAKIPEREGASHHADCMGDCPTVNHRCLLYQPRISFFFFCSWCS